MYHKDQQQYDQFVVVSLEPEKHTINNCIYMKTRNLALSTRNRTSLVEDREDHIKTHSVSADQIKGGEQFDNEKPE